MRFGSFFDTPEEFFIGAALQFPLYFIIGWWILPVMAVCGILWRLGGWEFGHKAFRWLGAPFLICTVTFIKIHDPLIFLAAPFMVKIAPSYGEKSWLFKLIKNDFLTRIITYAWYWLAFSSAYLIASF